MWIRAFVFSLKVLKKSFCKLLVPAFLGSIIMLFLCALMAHIFRSSFSVQLDPHGDFYFVLLFILASVVLLWTIYVLIFKWLYPAIRSRVLFQGFAYLHPGKYKSYSDIAKHRHAIESISLLRFSSQRITSLLVCFLPVVALVLFVAVRIEWIIWIVLTVLYVYCLIPVIRGYLTHFYTDCKVIAAASGNETYSKYSSKSTLCSHWKSILLWKVILSFIYLALLILLGFWMVNVQGLGSYFYLEELASINEYFHVVYGFTYFIYGFAIAPFFSPLVQFPYGFRVPYPFQLQGVIPILIQIGFIVLLGLLTTFFFFVETLSTVYFFHQSEEGKIKIQDSIDSNALEFNVTSLKKTKKESSSKKKKTFVWFWVSVIALVILVSLVFVPTSKQYYFYASMKPVQEELVVLGTLQEDTLNIYNRNIKENSFASFVPCSLNEKKNLAEVVRITGDPRLHNHVVDVVSIQNSTITLSDITLKRTDKRTNVLNEYSIVKLTSFNKNNETEWERTLGGDNTTYGNNIIIHNNCIYIVGETSSPDFPAENNFQINEIYRSAFFIACFDLEGNKLWASLIQNTNDSSISSARILEDRIYITGHTISSEFPVKNAFQNTLVGDCNTFVSCFTLEGELVWSTYLGGEGMSQATSLTLNENLLFITGWTSSLNFPVKNAFQDHREGDRDAFVSCFTLSGNLVWSTYLGGTNSTKGQSCLATQNRLFVTGSTASTNFPLKSAFQQKLISKRKENCLNYSPLTNGFLTSFSFTGDVITSTYIGFNGYPLHQFSESPTCNVSSLQNGNLLLSVEEVTGTDNTRLLDIKHNPKAPNLLLYEITEEGQLVQHYYLF